MKDEEFREFRKKVLTKVRLEFNRKTTDGVRSNLERMYKGYRFPIILSINDRNSQPLTLAATTIAKELESIIGDFETLGSMKEFNKAKGFQLINTQDFIRRKQSTMIKNINEVIRCAAVGFPIQKTQANSKRVWCCWKIMDDTYLELVFCKKRSKISERNVCHILLSAKVLLMTNQDFDTVYMRSNGWISVPEPILISRLVNTDDLSDFLSKTGGLIPEPSWEHVPEEYWYLPTPDQIRAGFKFIKENDPRYPIVRSKQVPSFDAVLIDWNGADSPELYQLLDAYEEQKDAAQIAAIDGYVEPSAVFKDPNEKEAFKDWAKQFINVEQHTSESANGTSLYKYAGIDMKIGHDFSQQNTDTGALHILLRHWDQFGCLLGATDDEEEVMEELRNLQKLIDKLRENAKNEKDKDIQYDIKKELIHVRDKLEKQRHRTPEVTAVLTFQKRVMNVISAICNSKNSEHFYPRSGHTDNTLIYRRIRFGPGEKYTRNMRMVISNNPLMHQNKHAYQKIISTYFIKDADFDASVSDLKYWFELKTGKIRVLNKRDIKNNLVFLKFKDEDTDAIISRQPVLVPNNTDPVQIPNDLNFKLKCFADNDAELREFPTNTIVVCHLNARELITSPTSTEWNLNDLSNEVNNIILEDIKKAEKKGEQSGFASNIKASYIELRGLECNATTERAIKAAAIEKFKSILTEHDNRGTVKKMNDETCSFYEIPNTKLLLVDSKQHPRTISFTTLNEFHKKK